MNKEIFICGDPHGRFDHIITAVLEHVPAAVILLGDNNFAQPAHIELMPIIERTAVWWIHGNHDCDEADYYDNLFGSELADRNLHSRVTNVAGYRIAGLGGVVRRKVWDAGITPEQWVAAAGKGNLWRGGMSLRHRASIFPSDLENLAVQQADILITHEAPDLHPHGFAGFTSLAERMGVTRAFHGHHHQDISDYPGGTWVGVGEHGIQAWPSGKIICPGTNQRNRT